MTVRKIGFVGFRSQSLDAVQNILERGLGLVPKVLAPDQVTYQLDDGTRLECYSETNSFHAFFTTGPVVGFQVDNFQASWAKLQGLGVVALTEVQTEAGQSWVHFPLPDGTVVELIGSDEGPDEPK
jgi:hypothetical protein